MVTEPLPAERPIGRMGFAPTGDRRLSRHTEHLEYAVTCPAQWLRSV